MSASRLPSDHEHLEQLCAALAIGELSPSETRLIGQHMRTCQSCSDLYRDFCQLGADVLVLSAVLSPDVTSDAAAEPGAVEQHLDNLYKKLGLPTTSLGRKTRIASAESQPPGRMFQEFVKTWQPVAFWASVAALLLVVISATWLQNTRTRQSSEVSQARTAAYLSRLEQLNQRVRDQQA